jgi:aspartyl-tRNA(Asn)/glutamyl-tRNA(Gln) amidotransferase subunit A
VSDAGELHGYGLTELRRKIEAREISPVEVTEAALARAERVGRELHAFVALDPRGALGAARAAERALAHGKTGGPLLGVPVHVKDLMLTKGVATTAGSRAPGLGLPDDRDAAVVRRLRRAGAVILGKTNLNEFAYGVTGENSHFGDVPTPWDRQRMSGGSSSGAAAALAAGIGYGSVGTDTRGSIRIPAANCGVTGIKPTRGLVPDEGVFPLSWTLDHTGPFARSAEDVAVLLGVMASGRGGPLRYAAALDRPVAGLRIGVAPFYFRDLDEEVEGAVRAAVAELVGAGLEVVEVDLPELEPCLPASAAIAASEALVIHDERLKAGGEGYGAQVRQRLEAAYAYSGLDLARAERVRRDLIEAYHRAFRDVDCMVGPCLPGLPAPIGSATMRVAGGREEPIVNASCRLMAPQNMTGVPAASVPCGFSASGLPVGLQLWAAEGADDLVLAVAHAYQQRTEWHRRRPEARNPSPLEVEDRGVAPA